MDDYRGDYWDAPVVVRMRDDVTGALSVVPTGEIRTVIDVWFPHLTPEARGRVDNLLDALASEDWERVHRVSRTLAVRIERFTDGAESLPSPRSSPDVTADRGGDEQR